MDFTLQKAVELGVNKITPLITERVQFRLDHKRLDRKMSHWQKVIESACEQSGRSTIPDLSTPIEMTPWLNSETCPGLIFIPEANIRLKDIDPSPGIRILIGPEGGLSEREIRSTLKNHPFTATSLGPRILRTETAALAAISILQSHHGDI